MEISTIQKATRKTKIKLPIFLCPISAGFPSPATDYEENKLDLNRHLIKHPAATFFLKVEGTSMRDAGIQSGDTIIVDRSLEIKNNDVIVAMLDGEFTVKRISKNSRNLYLKPENPNFKPIKITKENDFEIWGKVIHVIHSFK